MKDRQADRDVLQNLVQTSLSGSLRIAAFLKCAGLNTPLFFFFDFEMPT